MVDRGRWGGYLDQMVGVTSWLDTYLPAPLYRIWQFTAAGLLLWATVLLNHPSFPT